MEKDKKYYWLKLKKDFFKRHDIKIIESMQNGKDYVLFYLKLLVESIDHDGSLRFNETIPYDENMLSIITCTNVDIVRSAMKILMNLELVEIQEDKTIFMAEVERMIGTETYWAEKKREYRDNKVDDKDIVLKLSEASPTCPSKSIDLDLDSDLDTDLEKDKIEYSYNINVGTETSDNEYIEVSKYLYTKVKAVLQGTHEPSFKQWAKHIDMLIRLDGFTIQDIYNVINWVFADSFWNTNIRSTSKLRDKFPTLKAQMERKGSVKATKSGSRFLDME